MSTVKEHYIPQVYLRGFAKDGNNIWFYDFEKKFFPKVPVPTKSVCYEEHLYEVRNSKGEIVLENYLENCLGVLERMFSKYRAKIKRKSYEENQKTCCFLTKEEKVFWVTYIMLQILREPEVITSTEKVCSHFYSGITTENNIKNISRMLCLPLFDEVKEDGPFMYLVNTLLDGMINMGFVVAIDESESLITSDFPVCVHSSSRNLREIDRVIFPIDSKTCLLLLNEEDQRKYGKNKLYYIETSIRNELNLDIASGASKKIFFKDKITNHEVRLYEKEREKYKRPVLGDFAF